MSFTVIYRLNQFSISVGLTRFDDLYRPDVYGCFLHKLTLASSSGTVRLQHPGQCRSINDGQNIEMILDDRDFFSLIQSGLTNSSLEGVWLTTNDNVLDPPFLMEGIPQSSPLFANSYEDGSDNSGNTRLLAFDFYHDFNRFLLHFETFITVSSFAITDVRFVSQIPTEPVDSNTEYSLSNSSNVCSSGSLTKTLCVEISNTDRMVMNARGICTNGDNCVLWFEFGLAVNTYNGLPIRVITNHIIPVSMFWTMPPSKSYMNL